MVHQQAQDLEPLVDAGYHDDVVSLVVDCAHVCSISQQELHGRAVVEQNGPVKWGVTLVVLLVDVTHLIAEELLGYLQVPLDDSDEERRVAGLVFQLLETELHRVTLTATCWCCEAVVFRVPKVFWLVELVVDLETGLDAQRPDLADLVKEAVDDL